MKNEEREGRKKKEERSRLPTTVETVVVTLPASTIRAAPVGAHFHAGYFFEVPLIIARKIETVGRSNTGTSSGLRTAAETSLRPSAEASRNGVAEPSLAGFRRLSGRNVGRRRRTDRRGRPGRIDSRRRRRSAQSKLIFAKGTSSKFPLR